MDSTNTNREAYNSFASDYDNKRKQEADSLYNRYLDQPMIEQLTVGLPDSCDVLDLGCGSGILTTWLKQQGHNPQGIDFSDGLIEIARKENPETVFKVGDMKALPHKAHSFDAVVSALVMHYERDLEPIFKQVARVLSSKGKFIFTVHHPVAEVTVDNDGDKQNTTNTTKPYFHNHPYQWSMFEGMELTSYHHTFEAISTALCKADFVIEQIIEASPDSSLKKAHPEFYERTSRFPSFCGFRARKNS